MHISCIYTYPIHYSWLVIKVTFKEKMLYLSLVSILHGFAMIVKSLNFLAINYFRDCPLCP